MQLGKFAYLHFAIIVKLRGEGSPMSDIPKTENIKKLIDRVLELWDGCDASPLVKLANAAHEELKIIEGRKS